MELVYHDLSRINEIQTFIHEWNNNDSYILCQTSGTTGSPRTIKLSKVCIRHSAERTIEFFKLKAGDKVGLPLSTKTIAGKLMVIRALLASLELHVLAVTIDSLTYIEQELDFIAMVPNQATQYALKNSGKQKAAAVLIGGAPLTHTQYEIIHEYWENAFQSYGMTETATHVALRKISGDINAPYQALPGIEFETFEDCLRIISTDFPEGINTNDQVILHSPTAFSFLGRLDFAINVGGTKIHPEQLEHKLNKRIQGEFVVLPVIDALYGSSVGIAHVENQVFSDAAFNDLNSAEKPRMHCIIEKVLRNENGKINRQAMILEAVNYEWQKVL